MRPIFIGDEATASGYRLAGLDARTPAMTEIRDALHEALEAEPPLILVTMEYARQLEADERARLFARVSPPILPVADAGGRVPAGDLAAWIRAGILT
ncbi:MAG: hypothetical protein GWO02_16560 [Gammaproteobacteria bacterium]|nr:hypothetical protein [Gammaproteobacteria bacterium]